MNRRRGIVGFVGRHPGLAAAALLLVVGCLWFWPLFKGDQLGQDYVLARYPPWAGATASSSLPQRLVFPDAALQFHPWAAAAKRELRGGALPLWNPYEYGGTPLVGNMQSALFLPFSWLLLALPFGYAWGVFALLKTLTAGFGAYALGRELRIGRDGALVAGVVYMLSAPLMVLLQFPLGTAAALFPWLLLALTRLLRRATPSWLAGVAVALALMLFAGHPESALIALSAAMVYVVALGLAERSLSPAAAARVAGGLLLGVAIAAIALIPFLQALGPSITRTQHELRFPTGGLGATNLLQYAVPGLFGNAEPHVYGYPFGYFGLPALLLATVAIGRRGRTPAGLAVLAMAGVALMAIYHVPPVGWFVEHVPPWSNTYIRERAFFVPALAGALGAGAGISSLVKRPLPLRRVAGVAVGVGAVVLAGVGAAQLSGDLSAPASDKREALAVALSLLAGAAIAVAALGRLRPWLAVGLTGAVAVLALADLQDLNPILPPAKAYPARPDSIAFLQRRREPFHLGVLRDRVTAFTLLPNTADVYGLEGVEGYDFPLSKRWSDFQTSVLGFRSPSPESRIAREPPTPAALTALRMMNVRYYLADPAGPPPLRGLETAYHGRDARVLRDPQALPRAYVVPVERRLGDRTALSMLARGALDPRREAIVPPGAPSAPTVRQGRFRPASAKRLGPDHVRVTIPPGSAGWLVLANAYSRTWKATVGGRDVKPQPTDFAAMGVPVRPGTHRVDFRLDRSGFWAGAWITLAALALTLLLAAWRPLRGLTPPGAHRRRFGRRGSATSERVAP